MNEVAADVDEGLDVRASSLEAGIQLEVNESSPLGIPWYSTVLELECPEVSVRDSMVDDRWALNVHVERVPRCSANPRDDPRPR
jgi:hypothetical protein